MIKIYQIYDFTNGNSYVGSTEQYYLSKRIGRHREESNTCSSKKVIENGNWKVILLEKFKDANIRKERERFWINNIHNCINTNKLNGVDKEKQKKRLELKKENDKSWGGLQKISNDIF